MVPPQFDPLVMKQENRGYAFRFSCSPEESRFSDQSRNGPQVVDGEHDVRAPDHPFVDELGNERGVIAEQQPQGAREGDALRPPDARVGSRVHERERSQSGSEGEPRFQGHAAQCIGMRHKAPIVKLACHGNSEPGASP